MLDLRLAVTNYGERGSIYIQPRVRVSAYADEDDEDLEDEEIFLRSYGEYSWPGATIGYYANAERQNIRNAEFRPSTPLDPDNPDPTDPGTGLRIITQGDREALWATPYIRLPVSDRSSIEVQLSHNDVFYTGPAVLGRSDFSQNEFSLGIVRSAGEITQVTARAFVSEFEADKNNNITDTVGIEGNFIQPLGATWTLDMTAGVQRNDFSYEDVDDLIENADTNITLKFALRKRADRTRLNFNAGRAIYPSGSGFISEVSDISMWVERRFSQRITGTLSTRYERTKTVDETSTLNDRDYLRFDIGLKWALTERWAINTGFQITEQEYENQPGSHSQSNSIFLGFSYVGLPPQY